MEAMNSTTVHSWCGCMHVVPYGRGLHGRRRPCQQHNLSPPDPLLLLLPLPLLPPPLLLPPPPLLLLTATAAVATTYLQGEPSAV